MTDLIKLYTDEQDKLKKYQEKDPGLVTPQRNFSYQEILSYIGINVDFGFLPQGYLNFYHQDFIVEEVDSKGEAITIEPGSLDLVTAKPGDKTLYAQMVKVGLSTLEARENLAQALGVPVKQINYGGIKDKVAITSQQISLRGINPEKVEEIVKGLKVSGLYLKNLSWGKGIIEKGKIRGNRFIITVRTPSTLGQGWLDQALDRVKDGFNNFYYLQRFGSPRLLSHTLGKLILQQEYEAVVKTFLTSTGVQDVPLLSRIREQAVNDFGNWQKLEELFSELPYTFRLELGLIRYLAKKPDDYLGALKSIEDQTTLWVYAYASYLFNLHLSSSVTKGETLVAELPLLLNPQHTAIKTYAQKLSEDNILDLKKSAQAFFGRDVLHQKNVCLTKVPVKVINTKIIEKGVVIAFELPVGAYATTFLTHLFSLYRGLPIPEWLDKTKHDGKKILNLGSVAPVEEVLGEYIFSQDKGQ
tara:strand:- start:1561 stop:2973 length:1413 start_codon:yes stop_codon:yes gene_type:complete